MEHRITVTKTGVISVYLDISAALTTDARAT